MKKNLPLRWLVTLFSIGLSVYYLFYSIRYYSVGDAAKELLTEKIPDLHKKIVNMGLDLQGGMRLVIEIDKSELSDDEKKDALDRTHTVITNRVNGLGLAEPSIQKQGEDRLIIELPGLQDAMRAKKVLGNTALLEFKLVREAADLQKSLEIIDKALSGRKVAVDSTDTTKAVSDTAQSKEEKIAASIFKGKEEEEEAEDSTADTTGASFSRKRPLTSLLVPMGEDIGAEERYKTRIDRMLRDTAVVAALRLASLDGSLFQWSNEVDTYSGKKYRRLFYLKKKPELTGSAVGDAKPNIASGGMEAGRAIVNLSLKGSGARVFAKVTGANIDKRLAIVLDSTVYSAPVIKSKITGGEAQITGMKSMDEARDLSIVLRAGALPAPAKIIEERTVGATLGKASINASIIATLVALAIVAVFMIFYYGFMGIVADIALLLNVILVFGFMAATNSTLTLPGVAGLILMIGMAVDANVLINERVREELRAGKTVRSAIVAGFDRAFTVIFDSNLTTVAAGVILYYYGSGPIRGFALTLSAGVIVNMFTALFVAHLICDTYTYGRELQTLSVGKIAVFRNANYRIIRVRKYAIGLSLALFAVTLISLVAHRGLNLGIDFRGGTLLMLKFEKPVARDIPKIEREIASLVKGAPEVKPIGKDIENTIQIMAQPRKTDEELGALIKARLLEAYPGNKFDLLKEEKVGPRIGKELKWNAMVALLLSWIFMIIYLGWRFKQISYGIGAVVAIVHDVVISIGFLSLTNREFSLNIVAALLTIIGYSVNDTIVVFDRVRENMRLRKGRDTPEELFNISVNQTLSRTFMTSFATLLAVIVLFIFGGQSINDFAFVMFVGMIAGSYSTIYIASPVVLWWQARKKVK